MSEELHVPPQRSKSLSSDVSDDLTMPGSPDTYDEDIQINDNVSSNQSNIIYINITGNDSILPPECESSDLEPLSTLAPLRVRSII